jgi:hypothetical protein
MEAITEFVGLLVREMVKNDEILLGKFVTALSVVIEDNYIRPLQESRILKKVVIAKMLDVSPATVTHLIETGTIKTTEDGHVTEYLLRLYITGASKTNQKLLPR